MALPGKQIMIIDDDHVLVTLLTRTLITVGCVVHACHSIKEALQTLKSHIPDLVILDLSMPEHDGFTFLKFRHQNRLLASIPVMVLSGTKKKEEIQKALELGADQFVEKPFESRIILQKLKYIFFSKENYTFTFPEGDSPAVEAEIQGSIIEQATGHMKVESQVQFCAGKSVQLSSEDYLKNGGAPVVCKVSNRLVELHDGFFISVLSPTGFDSEAKKHFELWQRSLT